MATLEDLRSAVLPGARWLVPLPAAPADLGWVRLMRARVPAFDSLDSGDVAIVPMGALAVVAPDAEALESVVRAAADATIGGLVLIGDPRAAPMRVPEALVAAALGANLPVLDAGPADAAAIERSAIGFLVNHRAELERQATILETRLEQLALARSGPDALAGAIAGFLGRSIAIEGRRGAAIAVHAPVDVAGAAAAVARYHERPRATGARIALPFPGEPLGAAGALVLLGDRPPSELDRAAANRIAGLLALELARDEEVGRAVDTARRDTLPTDGPPWVVLVARQAGGADDADVSTDPAAPAGIKDAGDDGSAEERAEDPRVSDFAEDPRVSNLASREALRRDLRAIAPASRMALRGNVQSVEVRIVAAAPAEDPEGVTLARRVAGVVGRVVAISRPFDDADGRPAAEADARATMEAAERLRDAPPVARADRLAAYRLLGNLHNLPEGERQARALLAPLLVGRRDVRSERLATLRAVLDQPGLAEAATVLRVHRNTVTYRVRRIEEATGWRLSDPELRFPLALALRLVQDD